MIIEVLIICIFVYILLRTLKVRFFQSRRFGSSIIEIQPFDKNKVDVGDKERVKFIMENSNEHEKIRIIYGECKRTQTIKDVLKKERIVDLLCGPHIDPNSEVELKKMRDDYKSTFRMFQYHDKRRPRNHAVVMRNSFFIEEPHSKEKSWTYALLLSNLHDDITEPFKKQFDEDLDKKCDRIIDPPPTEEAFTIGSNEQDSDNNSEKISELGQFSQKSTKEKSSWLYFRVLILSAMVTGIIVAFFVPIIQSSITIDLKEFVPSLIVVDIGASLLVFNLLNLMVAEVWDVHKKNRCLQSALLKLPFLDIDSCVQDGECKKGVEYIIHYSTEPITQQIKVIALSAVSLFIISEFAVIGYLGFSDTSLITLSFAFFMSAIIILVLIVADMLFLELSYYDNVQKGHRVMMKNNWLNKDEKKSQSS